MIKVSVVKTKIDDAKLWRALARPGGTGGLAAYRDALCGEIIEQGRGISPVNNPLNAKHRRGRVGTYKRSWRWARRDRRAAWVVGGIAGNTAAHAYYLEVGRSASSEPQFFSWAKYGGKKIWWVGKENSPLPQTRSTKPGRRIVTRAAGKAIAQHSAICAKARGNSPYSPRPTR